MIYVLSDDLLDSSKTVTSARAGGIPVKQFKNFAAIAVAAESQRPTCIILDLQSPGLSVADAMAFANGEPRVRVVAFGSHVDAEAIRIAKQCGCDEVMARSQFFKLMPTRIAEWAAPMVDAA